MRMETLVSARAGARGAGPGRGASGADAFARKPRLPSNFGSFSCVVSGSVWGDPALGFTTHLSRILRGHRLRRSTGPQRHKQKGWSFGRGAETRGDAGWRKMAHFHQASWMSKRSLSRPPNTLQSKFNSWFVCLSVHLIVWKVSQLSLSMKSEIQKWRPVLEGEVGQNWAEPSSWETESRPCHSPHISRGRSVGLSHQSLPKLSFFPNL